MFLTIVYYRGNSLPKSEVPVSANLAYRQVTSVAVQQDNVVQPPSLTAQYDNNTNY